MEYHAVFVLLSGTDRRTKPNFDEKRFQPFKFSTSIGANAPSSRPG